MPAYVDTIALVNSSHRDAADVIGRFVDDWMNVGVFEQFVGGSRPGRSRSDDDGCFIAGHAPTKQHVLSGRKVPRQHETCGEHFPNHVVQTQRLDKEPKEQFVQPETNDADGPEYHQLHATIGQSSGLEHPDRAQHVSYRDARREGYRRRDSGMQADKFCQNIQQGDVPATRYLAISPLRTLLRMVSTSDIPPVDCDVQLTACEFHNRLVQCLK